MKRLVLVLLVVVAGMTASCRRVDPREIKVKVPDMKNEKCAELVAKGVSRLPGVDTKNIRVDLVNRTVTVNYDSLQLAIKNIEFSIAEAGFTAIAETPFPNKGVPARPNAVNALPPECK